MKIMTFLLFVLSVMPAWAIDTLHINADETYTVRLDQQRLSLATLTIDDGATVVFAEGVIQWQVRAERAAIGSQVTINGSGKTGVIGASGNSGSAVADCVSGNAGAEGSVGGDGGNGVSIRLQLGLIALGDIEINSNGGAGGAGGIGGSGSDAGRFGKRCKSATVGGDAGAGGNGGNGGTAGDITVIYWSANSDLKASQIANLVRVQAKSGVAGKGGVAGSSGVGSEGRYIKKKTLTGNRTWTGGGAAGVDASRGINGIAGSKGRILVEQALIAAPISSKAPERQNSNVGSDQEIRAIKQELRSLLQRLDELEAIKGVSK